MGEEATVRLKLYFRTRIQDAETLLSHFQTLIQAFEPNEPDLEQTSHEKLEDRNWSKQAHTTKWASPNARLVAHVETGSGNPRDGYGYDINWRLTLSHPSGPLAVSATGASWSGNLNEGTFSVECADPTLFETVHKTLAARLDKDITFETYPLCINVEALLNAGHIQHARDMLARLIQSPETTRTQNSWAEHLTRVTARLEEHD